MIRAATAATVSVLATGLLLWENQQCHVIDHFLEALENEAGWRMKLDVHPGLSSASSKDRALTQPNSDPQKFPVGWSGPCSGYCIIVTLSVVFSLQHMSVNTFDRNLHHRSL